MPLPRLLTSRPWRPRLGLAELMAALCWAGLGVAVAQTGRGLLGGALPEDDLPRVNPQFSLPPAQPSARRLRQLETFEIRASRPLTPSRDTAAPPADPWVFASSPTDPRGQLHVAMHAPPPVPLAEPHPTASWLQERPRRAAPGATGPVQARLRGHAPTPLGADDASYRFAIRELALGRLPAPDAVHPESFVAALAPSGAPPDAVRLPTLPVDAAATLVPDPLHDGHHVLRLSLTGADAAERPPVHLVVVVDDSGSMGMDGRLELVAEALRGLASALGPDDTLAVVRYDQHAQVLLPARTPTPEAVERALRGLRGDGPSAMGEGLAAGWRLAGQLPRNGRRGVVLLTDGDANIGVSTRASWLKHIRAWRTAGVGFTAVTVGAGVHPSPLLDQMVEAGQGAHVALTGPAQARAGLRTALVDDLAVAVSALSAEMRFDPTAVESWRLVGWEGGRAPAPLDRLSRGQTAAAYYDVVLRQGAGPSVGALTVRGEVRDQHKQDEIAVTRSGGSFATAPSDLQVGYVAARFGERLQARDAQGLARLARLADAARRQGSVADIALLTAIRQASSLAARPRLEAGDEAVRAHIRDQAEQLQYCYASARGRHPGVQGDLLLQLAVYAGRVDSVAVLSQTTGDRVLEACAVRKVRRWRFSRELDADVVVSATLQPPVEALARSPR